MVRDIIQNHLLQVMSLVTMEVPASFSADDIRDEKSQVLRSVRNLDLNDVANHCVRGQYRGYRQEDGVAPDSQTPTYAAMRFMIDSWRWQGVPFYLRAGKKLAERLTEVNIHFRAVPARAVQGRGRRQRAPARGAHPADPAPRGHLAALRRQGPRREHQRRQRRSCR